MHHQSRLIYRLRRTASSEVTPCSCRRVRRGTFSGSAALHCCQTVAFPSQKTSARQSGAEWKNFVIWFWQFLARPLIELMTRRMLSDVGAFSICPSRLVTFWRSFCRLWEAAACTVADEKTSKVKLEVNLLLRDLNFELPECCALEN